MLRPRSPTRSLASSLCAYSQTRLSNTLIRIGSNPYATGFGMLPRARYGYAR